MVRKRDKHMGKDELFEKYAGRYRLVKFVIGGADRSEMYANGRAGLIGFCPPFPTGKDRGLAVIGVSLFLKMADGIKN